MSHRYQIAPGAFYEALANVAGWRWRCDNCRCPEWAHGFKSIRTEQPIVVGACACGACRNYVPRPSGLNVRGNERDGNGTIRTLKKRDSKRIVCGSAGCRAQAEFCRSVEWQVSSRASVSFFYRCARHAVPSIDQILRVARVNQQRQS
jgi:hypothetical protein